MKQIGEPRKVTARNGIGHDSTCIYTVFEIEPEDAGRIRDHYLGYQHKSLTIQRSDVGRHIDVMTDGSGWTCWSFVDKAIS